MRDLGADEAMSLNPGDEHYRAYVGPPDRFDFMSATQFALLFQLGLRETHSVLDFGCGSLRLGRVLIPFLREGGYFGIDPNRWLIEDGLARELGQSIKELKKPAFSYNDDFDCRVFNTQFDFIVAQSILTHAGREMTEAFFASSLDALKERGLLVFNYIKADHSADGEKSTGWHYPYCVSYTYEQMSCLVESAGFAHAQISWYHPAHTWHIAAKSEADLPPREQLELLNGAVLRSDQFAESIR